jgi:hypothetical protein
VAPNFGRRFSDDKDPGGTYLTFRTNRFIVGLTGKSVHQGIAEKSFILDGLTFFLLAPLWLTVILVRILSNLGVVTGSTVDVGKPIFVQA